MGRTPLKLPWMLRVYMFIIENVNKSTKKAAKKKNHVPQFPLVKLHRLFSYCIKIKSRYNCIYDFGSCFLIFVKELSTHKNALTDRGLPSSPGVRVQRAFWKCVYPNRTPHLLL